jgi:hypothetical protein
MLIIQSLKCTIDWDIKVLNHILLTLASDHDEQKTKPWIQYFSLKINWLNQPIMKLAYLMQHRRKYEAKIVMKVRVLKLKCINSTISGSLSFCGSFMIPVTTSQGINNYSWITTYWSCIVPISIFINLASNILLLASKKCFLTSLG